MYESELLVGACYITHLPPHRSWMEAVALIESGPVQGELMSRRAVDKPLAKEKVLSRPEKDFSAVEKRARPQKKPA